MSVPPDYRVAIDSFKVFRNNSVLFDDLFSDALPPPLSEFALDNPPGTPVYDTKGIFGEAGGRAVMESVLGATGDEPGETTHVARLNTDTSDDMSKGLKSDDAFTVEARFDFAPRGSGGVLSYGIGLTDQTATQIGDDTLRLMVQQAADGTTHVVFVDFDFTAGTSHVLADFLLPVAPYDQIVLRLSHGEAQAGGPGEGDAGAITASFDLISDGVVAESVALDATGHIFGSDTPETGDDEAYTRPEIVVEHYVFGGADIVMSAAPIDFSSILVAVYPVIGTDDGDTLQGSAGVDLIDGAAGDDTLYGEGEDDSLNGGAGGDHLYGGAGADMLEGDAGADTLEGGSAVDRLTGGAGADTFVLDAPGGAYDIVMDFKSAEHDRLAVHGDDYGLEPGPLSVDQLAGTNAADATHARFLFDQTTNTLLWDDDGLKATAAVAIAMFGTNVALVASDFVIL